MFIKKAVVFQTLYRLFFYKDSLFFSTGSCFFRGKAPFIFDAERFTACYGNSLQASIGTVLDPACLCATARETGFLRRASKLRPDEFIDMLVFSSFDHSQLSLQECCNDLAQQRQKSLSKVGLHKRFNQSSVAFLKAVLAKQIALKTHGLSAGDDWKYFSRVWVADSCKFALPDDYDNTYCGYKSFGNRLPSPMMNLQYSFDLKHGDWGCLEFTRAVQNDQSHSNKTVESIQKGELHIRDLGFITMTYLAGVVSKQAFFLNRLHPQWKPVQKYNGKRIDWTALYQKIQGSRAGYVEKEVTIGNGKEAFDCRLIAVAVPEQVWAERIRKAQQKMKSSGCNLSDDYKARCRFNIFITNTPAGILNAQAVIQLYGLRWQIELIFKSWKSLLHIHKVKAVKKDRFECQLLARFIWILLNWKIFQCINAHLKVYTPAYACSIWKFFKQARSFSHALRRAVCGNSNITEWLNLFLFPIIKSLLIEPKKDKKPAYMIVNDVFKA